MVIGIPLSVNKQTKTMNISSIIVQTNPEFIDSIVKELKSATYCEYALHDEKGRIIVTIEAEGVEQELENLRQIEKIEGVMAANMHFLYSEDELDKERDKLEKQTDIPEWMNNPTAEFKDISYNGDLKGKY